MVDDVVMPEPAVHLPTAKKEDTVMVFRNRTGA